MQKNKIIFIMLILLDMMLVGVCGYYYLTMDRTPPKINFSTNEEILYRDDIPQEELLKGIGAVDNVDGDISDKIVIEKILKKEARGVAVVYYAICDSKGNVSKASRELKLDKKVKKNISED